MKETRISSISLTLLSLPSFFFFSLLHPLLFFLLFIPPFQAIPLPSPSLRNKDNMNILVYEGNGVSQGCLMHLMTSLRASCSLQYDIKTISAESLKHDPWTFNCSCLFIPGGRDIPYLNDWGLKGYEKINHYVRDGGKIIGYYNEYFTFLTYWECLLEFALERMLVANRWIGCRVTRIALCTDRKML